MKNKIEKEMDLFGIFKILWFKKKNILLFSTLVSSIALFYVLFATPFYESYTSIYPVNENSQSQNFNNIQGIASTFGINIGSNQQSHYNISDLVKSNSLRRKIILNKWKTEKFKRNVNLIEYWSINDTNSYDLLRRIKTLFKQKISHDIEQSHIEIALEILKKRLKIIENETGLIKVSIMMEEGRLASDIVNYIAKEIKLHVRSDLYVESSDHRKFIENRMDKSKIELSISESKLTDFRKKNPIILDTPEIQLQRGRLIRDVEVNQQVYITLRQQYEIAKIEELKSSTVIKVLDKGVAPFQKSKPQRAKIIILSFLISIIISSYFTYFKERSKMIFN